MKKQNFLAILTSVILMASISTSHAFFWDVDGLSKLRENRSAYDEGIAELRQRVQMIEKSQYLPTRPTDPLGALNAIGKYTYYDVLRGYSFSSRIDDYSDEEEFRVIFDLRPSSDREAAILGNMSNTQCQTVWMKVANALSPVFGGVMALDEPSNDEKRKALISDMGMYFAHSTFRWDKHQKELEDIAYSFKIELRISPYRACVGYLGEADPEVEVD